MGVVMVGLGCAIVGFCVWIRRHYHAPPLLSWIGWKRWWVEFGIAVAIFIGWGILSGTVNYLLGVRSGTARFYHKWDGEPIVIYPAIFALAGMSIWPVAEELLYRATFFRGLRSHVHVIFAVVIQAVAFAAMHNYPVVPLIEVFVLGMLLQGVYLWRKTLWTPIFFHVINNGVVLLLILTMILLVSGRTFLGISIYPAKERTDCRIAVVYPDTAATEAGLMEGDIIIEVDFHPIATPDDVWAAVHQHKPGQTMTMIIDRNGDIRLISIQLRAYRPHLLW